MRAKTEVVWTCTEERSGLEFGQFEGKASWP